MKNLFICLTDFQILNTLSLIQNDLDTFTKNDIFLVNNKVGNYQLAQRLKKTNLFENVIMLDTAPIQGLHYYIRNLTERKENISFLTAIKNSLSECRYQLMGKLYGTTYKINSKIILGLKINFSSYKAVFCLDKRSFIPQIVNQICLDTKHQCKINLLDEGTSTYWKTILTPNFQINNIFLKEPQLANYYNSKWKNRIFAIPKIDVKDTKFKKLVNFIWQFTDNEQYKYNKDIGYSINNSIVFFDQNWDPMPEYFSRLNSIMRLLLRNAYKKHKKESAFYDGKMRMFRIVTKYCDGNNVIVKLHPRSPLSFVDDYKKSHCTMAPSLTIPWEVFMDNCTFYNNIWITVSSTALCSYKMAFKNTKYEIPMIFLYRIVYKGNMDFSEDEQFFKNFQNMYPDSVYIPETIDEFIVIYKKLINKMNQKERKNGSV